VKLVGKSPADAFAGYGTTPNEPNILKLRPQVFGYEQSEIARMEFDGIPSSWEIGRSEDKGGLLPIGPLESLAFEINAVS